MGPLDELFNELSIGGLVYFSVRMCFVKMGGSISELSTKSKFQELTVWVPLFECSH